MYTWISSMLINEKCFKCHYTRRINLFVSLTSHLVRPTRDSFFSFCSVLMNLYQSLISELRFMCEKSRKICSTFSLDEIPFLEIWQKLCEICIYKFCMQTFVILFLQLIWIYRKFMCSHAGFCVDTHTPTHTCIRKTVDTYSEKTENPLCENN